MNGYDFDKTIYDGDSTIDFYIYSLKRNITLIRFLPIQVYGFILYTLKLKRKEYFKEKFFSFLKGINNIDNYVTSFWNKNESKIKDWYLKQKKDNDIIISASPDFLLKEIINRLELNYLIATIVDEKSGKFLSNNCYGKEKVVRFKEIFKNKKLNAFYTDSLSDMPMIKISKVGYIVKGNEIKKLN